MDDDTEGITSPLLKPLAPPQLPAFFAIGSGGRLPLRVLLAAALGLFLPLLFSHLLEGPGIIYAIQQHVDPDTPGSDAMAGVGLALWAVLLLPTSVFEVAVGYAFGFPRGLAITWAGKTAGGIVAFLLGRSLLRDWATAVLQSHPVLRGIQSVINHQVITVVFLVRAAYIPMAIKNYGLSMCPGVTLRTFVLASSLVNVPYSAMWAWWGSALQLGPVAQSPEESEALSALQWVTLGIAAAASALLVLLTCHWTAKLYSRIPPIPPSGCTDI
jgi:uncharacterized membrane protein YdjX (TVP38/TMEM64 family)